MSKYAPLRRYLAENGGERIAMTFAEIERIIGVPLPPSRRYPAWWSNNPSNNVMTREWLAAGYESEQVDVAGEKLVFRRAAGLPPDFVAHFGGFGERGQPEYGAPGEDANVRREDDLARGRRLLEALYGSVSGLATLAPGFDPARPWDEEEFPEPDLPRAGQGRVES
jgi:hypothetical protein